MGAYGCGMVDTLANTAFVDSVETVLRDELAHGDAMLGSIGPILRHLLANDDHSIFGDEIIARVRGMLADIARQLLDELAQARNDAALAPVHEDHDDIHVATLLRGLIDVPGFMAHTHALALEWQLTERLQNRHGLDPVLTPLLQALIASSDAGTAAIAMNLLAAQARFVQSQRRMQLPLCELPADLLHGAVNAMRAFAGGHPQTAGQSAKAEQAVRQRYDESRSRLGLIARLVTGMGGGAVAALSVTHAGAAIFSSALAIAAGQDRDLAVLSTNESQMARLALALRAAGVKPHGVEEQFIALHPDVTLPDGFERIGPDRAAAILAVANSRTGG